MPRSRMTLSLSNGSTPPYVPGSRGGLAGSTRLVSTGSAVLTTTGSLTVGRSIATAFARLYMIEWACTAQVRTLSMGRELQLPSQAVQDKQGQMMGSDWVNGFAEQRFWPAMLRKAQRECPGFDV